MSKIDLSKSGAEELKTLAQAMPQVIGNIDQAARDLYSTFLQLEKSLGPHTGDILDILDEVVRFKDNTADAIDSLAARLWKTASQIEDLVAKNLLPS